ELGEACHFLLLALREPRGVLLLLALELGEACRFLLRQSRRFLFPLARQLGQARLFGGLLLAQRFEALLLLQPLALEIREARGLLLQLLALERGLFLSLAREHRDPRRLGLLLLANLL